MDIYQAEELHLFRRGRTYGHDHLHVDNFGKGMTQLQEGKLEAWILEMTRPHGLTSQVPRTADANKGVVAFGTVDEPNSMEMEPDKDLNTFTPGSMRIENGNLIIDIRDVTDGDKDEIPEQEDELLEPDALDDKPEVDEQVILVQRRQRTGSEQIRKSD
ncbi:hypothetical protein L208DRAFT_1374942 [Tricholoma matsutake]|nr:hypothetical protein L208DRAFT_1374942 [Tricholoma matsutake 945]